MKMFKITFLSACIVALVGCLDNNTGTKPVVDPGGITEYYVVNQSGSDLNATYKLAPPMDVDSTVTVPTDSTSKIFAWESIVGNFPPSQVFAKIGFYKLSDVDMKSPLLAIDPIADRNWKFTTVNGDDLAKYKLVITKKDLK
jgi:hypothetical protein